MASRTRNDKRGAAPEETAPRYASPRYKGPRVTARKNPARALNERQPVMQNSTTSALAPLFTWRSAICESTLSPTARHVGLTLSLYMNERGGSAYPGAARLARETGLSLRCVRKQLLTLETEGWLTCVERGGLKGEARRATEYVATVPPVHQVHPCTTVTGEPDDMYPCTSTRVPVHQVHPNSPENSPENSPIFAPTKNRPARNPNPVWDALLLACGWDAVPPPKRSGFGRCVRDLQAMGATPEDIAVRARIYRRLMPDCVLTPFALVNQWGTCNPAMAIDQLASPTRQQSRSDAAILAGVDASFAKRGQR